MKYLTVILLSILFQGKPTDIAVDKVQAKKAFELLNKIRQHPEEYYKELKFDLKTARQRPCLQWNETLAAVAEKKAMDMAKRNYFSHIDPDGYGINYYINKSGYKLDPNWLTNRKDNNFESISAGNETGEAAIKTLIIDEGVPSKGHRKHLLGLDEWNSSMVDIGIGFVKGNSKTQYITYVSVLIAKHK